LDYNINFPHLHIYLDHVGKTISIGNFTIAYYGIVVTLGMVAGLLLACHMARKKGQDPDVYFDLALIDIVCALIGARIYYVAFRWDLYKGDPVSILNVRQGGLAIYGGVIGGVLATFVFSRVRKIPFGRLVDIAGLGLVLGQIIGRWGNFFNREAFGGYTDNLFAMQLPISAVRTSEITEAQWEHAVVLDGITYIQVHPTFLYEALWNLLLLIILLLFFDKKKFEGEIFLRYLLGYGIGRFWIESLRTDQLLLPVIGYPVSRALAALLVAVAAVWIACGRLRCRQKATNENVTDMNTEEYTNERT
jgi:phosphatidylglycerol:prolipoprotein diacylglycerol transferase